MPVLIIEIFLIKGWHIRLDVPREIFKEHAYYRTSCIISIFIAVYTASHLVRSCLTLTFRVASYREDEIHVKSSYFFRAPSKCLPVREGQGGDK